MKKNIISLFATFALCLPVSADYYMCLKQNDGTVIEIAIDDTYDVDFVECTPEGEYKYNPNVTYDYVDLGLPSGLLWATANVGATKPEERGDYFAWGETEPKDKYTWRNYRWCNKKKYDVFGGPLDFTKYVRKNYDILPLQPEDDAIKVNCGNDWRMPTGQEWFELVTNCTRSEDEINGVKGIKYTAKNGNSIFFPYTGYMDEDQCMFDDIHIIFWLNGIKDTGHYGITRGIARDVGSMSRYIGLPLRAVYEKKASDL